jgi:hypothetical protein
VLNTKTDWPTERRSEHNFHTDIELQLVRGLLGFSRCELLLLEAGSWGRGQSGNLEEGNIRRWKPLPSNGSEDVNRDTNVCVTVNCKV